MSKPELEIAQLAHTILGEPEENLDLFKTFFAFGVSQEADRQNQTTDLRIRTLALLSATAVLIDIFPTLMLPEDSADAEQEKGKKVSKEYLGKMKRSKLVVEFFDSLLQKLNKLKIVRGVGALLKSPVCSPQCLDQRRLQQLVSSAVSLACTGGTDGLSAIKERITTDIANHVDNLDIVKLIVTSISREKQPNRLNMLLPVLGGVRFSTSSITKSTVDTAGGKVDRKLLRDLATGRGDYVDMKKLKQTEAHILAEVIALYIRVARGAQSGQYSTEAIQTCIEGLATNTGSVNSDLAIELEDELMKLAKFYLFKQDSTEGILGATALSAVLNITKGVKERSEILGGSVIGGVEALVPLALEKLLQQSGSGEVLSSLCKGTIAISAQFGSDKALLAVARALLTSLCMRFDDQSKLAAELLTNVTSRSALVRTAIDPEGILVDGPGFTKEEVCLYHPLSSLIGNYGPDSEMSNRLLGNMAKYCRDLASRVRIEAAAAAHEEKVIERKRASQTHSKKKFRR
jgi:hypothetical protein